MGEAARDVELAAVFERKVEALPLQVGARVRAHVDDDVMHGALQRADDLHFVVRIHWECLPL